MAIKNILLEIGTEEIPSRFIPNALELLKKRAGELFDENRIEFRDVKTYATPRRLVLFVTSASEQQKAAVELLKGPPVKNAFDGEGNPTVAATGFAKSKGVSVDDLKEITDARGVKYLAAEIRQKSRNTMDVLPGLMQNLISSLNFPKGMYWNKTGIRFARPIRWIVALADEKIIPFEYAGVVAGRISSGHRFMGHKMIDVPDAGQFMDLLYDNSVILDQEKRLQKMKAGIANLQKEFGGNFEVELDPDILNENLYLVEYPVPFIGSFDKKFLEIPEEVLTTSMKKNQKYFAVRNRDKNDKLANYFVGISNNSVPDVKIIREGNERVLRARLEDAAFFWEEDRKKPLVSYVEKLKSVTYQAKLGSVYDQVILTRKLAHWLCLRLEDGEKISDLVDRAAYLSKADLLTSMVFEFPELQGVMGREYAKAAGEDPKVALALYEQYLPQNASDKTPTEDIGAILGIAQRVQIITACHKAGLEPTGTQDPYALRRAARCINEILWARKYNFNIPKTIKEACEINEVSEEIYEKIINFIEQRLLIQLRERGYDYKLATLGVAVIGDIPYQALRLVETLDGIKNAAWFSDLANSAVRVKNILAKNKSAIDDKNIPDENLMNNTAEIELWREIQRLQEPVNDALKNYEWEILTQLLAELSPVVGKFFNDVMVMDNNPEIRNNRLALLTQCNKLLKQTGDLGAL